MSAEIKTLHVPFEKFLRGEKIPFIRARSDRESTICSGHPDFSICLGGRLLLLEFKDKGGTLSPDQKRRIAELEGAGCRVYVLRELARAIELVQTWKASIGEFQANYARARPEVLRRVGAAFYRETPSGLQKVRNATAEEIGAR